MKKGKGNEMWEKLPNCKLGRGDCLELMQGIPDGFVDLVLCDPPYGTTACKWDSAIPFEPMWEQVKRVLKKNGAAVFTASQPFTSALVMSNVGMFKYCWVWKKSRPSGFAQAKNMPLKNYEDICVFSTGQINHVGRSEARMPYSPQGLVYSPRMTKNTKERHKDESAFGKRPSHKDEYLQEWTNYPTQILEFESAGSTVHPTQKPVALMEYLIKTYTNEAEVVFDFTMGSGTTGVACVNTGRRFIGIEKDESYYNIAKERIAKAIEAKNANET
jgi:site-specific DNA-methyltransferase (adenine-specific)